MVGYLRNKIKKFRQRIALKEIRANELWALELIRKDPTYALSLVSKHLNGQAEQMGHVQSGTLQAAQEHFRKSIAFPSISQYGYGSGSGNQRSLPKVTPYNLRRFSEMPPARRAINLVKYPIESMKWNVVPFMYVGDINTPMTTEQKVHREITMNCLNRPNHDDSWRMFISQVMEDMIIGGYGACELARTYNRARPYFLFPVDGSSIRINGEWAADTNEPRYVQSYSYSGVTGVSGREIQLYDDELIYFRMTPRTSTPFGLGYLEVAFNAVNAWLGAFEFSERRASNATPSYGIYLGDDADETYVRAYRSYWTDFIEGYGNIPIWGGGESPQVMQFRTGSEDELFLKWQEMLIRIIAMAFGLTALSLGIERDINRSTAGSLQIEEWSNIKPLISLVEDYITRRFVWKALGYRDLEFKFTMQDSDEKRQAEILSMRWKTDSITVNEVRRVYDQDPIEPEWGDLTMSRYTAKAKMDGGNRQDLDSLPYNEGL